MQAATFRGRRGIEPLRAMACRVAGWRVVFDKPPLIPTGESFASLVPEQESVALGVAYEVTIDDFEHIKLTEGVLIGNYELVECDAHPITAAGAGPLRVMSLSSLKRDPALRPSTRYMGLIIEGALEHGLPGEYVEQLRRIPARPPSLASTLARPLVDAFFKKS